MTEIFYKESKEEIMYFDNFFFKCYFWSNRYIQVEVVHVELNWKFPFLDFIVKKYLFSNRKTRCFCVHAYWIRKVTLLSTSSSCG